MHTAKFTLAFNCIIINLGWIILITATNGDAVLMVIPESEQFNNSTEFVSFACLESDYSEIPVEWLDPNRNVMIPTTETARICGNS